MEQLLLPALNFAILIGFLTFKIRKPLAHFVKNRHREIFDGLNRSKTQAAEAESRRKDVEAKLSTLDLERIKIAGEWKEREAQQILVIQESSQRVIAQMKSEAIRNKAALEEAVRLDALKTIRTLVLKQAEESIRKGLNPQVHNTINLEVTKALGV
jgi:F0F1-type ATP synthase membrane subunit b/b'